MRCLPVAFVLASGVMAVGTAPASAAPLQVTVQGRVTDEKGRGIPDVPVRLLQSRRDFLVLEWTIEDRLKDRLVARTDRHGFFETKVSLDPEYRSIWLRFYDPETFDAVRYGVPEDRDISKRARQGRPVFESVVLLDDPGWQAVRQLIEQLGRGTPQAKVVRQIGVPDRRDEVEGTERFWYEEQGVVYRFRDGQFIGQQPWDPESQGGSPKGS